MELVALLRKVLGVDRELDLFYRRASTIPWLRELLGTTRGVRPPRYPSLWEAFVRVVLFQQISLEAASTITGRLDTFPVGDVSVLKNLELAGAGTDLDLDQLLGALGDERGMLYYHLLLARLEARGILGSGGGGEDD